MDRQDLTNRIREIIEKYIKKEYFIGDVVDDILIYVDQYRETMDKIINRSINY